MGCAFLKGDKSHFSIRSWSRVRTPEFGWSLPQIMWRDCISDLALGSAHSTAELQRHHLMIKVCVSCVCDSNFSCEHVSTNGNGKKLALAAINFWWMSFKIMFAFTLSRLHHIEFLLDSIFYLAQNKLVYLLKIWPSLTAWRIARACVLLQCQNVSVKQTTRQCQQQQTTQIPIHFRVVSKSYFLFSCHRTHTVRTLASRHDWSALHFITISDFLPAPLIVSFHKMPHWTVRTPNVDENETMMCPNICDLVNLHQWDQVICTKAIHKFYTNSRVKDIDTLGHEQRFGTQHTYVQIMSHRSRPLSQLCSLENVQA